MKSLNQIMQGHCAGRPAWLRHDPPPLVLIWLAHLAQTKLGWGMWAMVAAILIGLVTAAVSTWSTVQRLLMKKDEGSAKKGASFNEHI